MRRRGGFPPALQDVPIKYVDSIAALDADQIDLLARANALGLKSIPVALSRLREAPDHVTIEYLFKDNHSAEQPGEAGGRGSPERAGLLDLDLDTIADILGECFPGMPSNSASALAGSPVMHETIGVVTAIRLALESGNLRSDFVIVSLYAVIKYIKAALEDRIGSNPAFLQTVLESGLVWEGEK